jgi:hypothetical protein
MLSSPLVEELSMNLNKLLYDSPGIGPAKLQTLLKKTFERVEIETRNEPFFTFQFRCEDENRTRLIIRYGWSVNKGHWLYEPIKVNE